MKHIQLSQKKLDVLVAIWVIRSLKRSNKEALRALLCEDYSDLTSPTSNQI